MSHDQEDWLAYTRIDWGYGRVTVHDGYSLTFEFVLSTVRDVRRCGAWGALSSLLAPPGQAVTLYDSAHNVDR